MSHGVTRALAGAVRLGMSVSIATRSRAVTPTGRRRSPWWLLLAGPAAGAALGIVARGWMRLITDEPEFSWSGTIFIVAAFVLTGFGHSVAWAVREAGWRRRGTLARVAGAVLTLPLFVGAGALMLPTVLAGSLALWRPDWPRWVRWVAATVAAAPPVMVVAGTAREHQTVRAAAGLVLFVATYAVVVASMRAIVAPGPRSGPIRRAARIGVAIGAAVLLLAVITFTVGLATADS